MLTVNFKKKTIKRTVDWTAQQQIQVYFHHLPEVIDYDSNMRLCYRCKTNYRKLSMVRADRYATWGSMPPGQARQFEQN